VRSYESALKEQRQMLKQTYRNMTDVQLEELAAASVRAHLRSMHPEFSGMSFDDFCRDRPRGSKNPV